MTILDYATTHGFIAREPDPHSESQARDIYRPLGRPQGDRRIEWATEMADRDVPLCRVIVHQAQRLKIFR
jgi:hypothetical protein